MQNIEGGKKETVVLVLEKSLQMNRLELFHSTQVIFPDFGVYYSVFKQLVLYYLYQKIFKQKPLAILSLTFLELDSQSIMFSCYSLVRVTFNSCAVVCAPNSCPHFKHCQKPSFLNMCTFSIAILLNKKF